MNCPGEVPNVEVRRAERGLLITATLLVTSFAIACVAQFGVSGVMNDSNGVLGPYHVFWPQGWSFFTPVDQDVLVAYRLRDDVLVPMRERRFADILLGGASGVNRRDDAWTAELRMAALRVPEAYWHECGPVVDGRCERSLANQVYRADSSVVRPELCGTLAIAVERFDKAVPRHLEPLPRRIHRIAVVDLRCPS